MLDTTNRLAAAICGVLHRHTGTECGLPAAAQVSHNGRALTFHVCARHARDYETPSWTVTYFARRIQGYTAAFSGICGAGFRSPVAGAKTLQPLAIVRGGK